MKAEIVQTCVVSLVPVHQSIDEPFSVRFARGGELPSGARLAGEVHLDLAATDPPEPLVGSSIDLGPIVVEHFVLAIDPYPRAPGAQLPPEATDSDSTPETSPFAALARLRPDSKEPG